MGQSQQTLRAKEVVKDLVFKPCQPPEYLEFNSQESFILSLTIDEQVSQLDAVHHLTEDAEQCGIAKWFEQAVSIPSKNVCIHAASKRKDQCTFEGIKGLFKHSANSVGTQGIFIFHFTGHAVCVRRPGKWGLVPTDYVGGSNPSVVITSSDMVDWLRQSTFQGRYCLFILDVCCAEGFADDVITRSVQQEIPVAGLYIISSRTANESSLIVPALGMTYFSFFFSTLNNHCDPGRIRVSDLYQSCNVCCMAFSSLILSYDQVTQTLRMNTTQPDYKQYQLPSYLRSLYGKQEDEESTDSGRFHFLFKHYDYSQNPIDIPEKCLAWLDTISDLNSGPLCELKEKSLLQGKMIIAAIATVTYSVALNMSCLLDSKLTPSRISSRNAFVITLLYVISAVEKHQSVNITPSDVCTIIDYYIEALNVKKISTKDVRKLKNLIIQQTQQPTAIEETDSGPSTSEQSEDDTNDHVEVESPSLNSWVPLKYELQDKQTN